jgi:hypothetical protein
MRRKAMKKNKGNASPTSQRRRKGKKERKGWHVKPSRIGRNPSRLVKSNLKNKRLLDVQKA